MSRTTWSPAVFFASLATGPHAAHADAAALAAVRLAWTEGGDRVLGEGPGARPGELEAAEATLDAVRRAIDGADAWDAPEGPFHRVRAAECERLAEIHRVDLYRAMGWLGRPRRELVEGLARGASATNPSPSAAAVATRGLALTARGAMARALSFLTMAVWPWPDPAFQSDLVFQSRVGAAVEAAEVLFVLGARERRGPRGGCVEADAQVRAVLEAAVPPSDPLGAFLRGSR